jgi:two-component system cell cycle sensor histidine kinase PleC
MFAYLRLFYVIGLLLCLGLAYFVGSMIRERTHDSLIQTVADSHRLIAGQYFRYIWQPYYPAASAPNRIAAMMSFREQSDHFFDTVHVVRMSVADGNGTVITRSMTEEIRDTNEQDILISALAKAGSATVFQRKLDKARIGVTNPETTTVFQSILQYENPAYRPDDAACRTGTIRPEFCHRILASVELVTDIEKQLSDIATIQWAAILSIAGIFILVLIILYLVAHRAEAIISKQHENNAELLEMATAAESKSKDKSDFLANISHELRTPLNAIIGFSDIIRSEAMGSLTPDHQSYVNDIHSSGTHLLTLINDILDFSKAEAGKLELDLNTVDLSKLIINSMRLVIPRAEEAQVTLNQDLPDENVECITDGKKLKQVLLNLLSNAVKFTPAGGEVRVTMWQKITDRTIHIEVSDTGIGIAPKDIAKVMAPFGQVDSKLSRQYEGTGLGLPLAKKFVEIMGGSFTLESEVNVGTKITIVLPEKYEIAQPYMVRDNSNEPEDQEQD